MPELDLHHVNELIGVREYIHGGEPGAPHVRDGHRVGESLNRSCIVLLSALLQGYVENVFVDASRRLFTALVTPEDEEDYRKSFRHWGNPSAENIERLFFRLGVHYVLNGLSWKNCPNSSVRWYLTNLALIRNQIAHGQPLRLNNAQYSLTLAKARRYRDFARAFGQRFTEHVAATIPTPNAPAN